MLRLIMCGGADDGRSTLIGRLLHESKMVENQSAVDGLFAEREQGRTIDVAPRYFSTGTRKFIVADTPGGGHDTRHIVTGASTADLAVILVDGLKGLSTETRRHSYLVSLHGIRQVVAVNKMDLVDYSEEVFRDIEGKYRAFAKELGLDDITAMPLSALRGDNMLVHSEMTPWYGGPTLLAFLESVELDETRRQKEVFRMPVQWVNRPDLDFRGFSGTIASGMVKPGDAIRAQPSGRESRIARIVTASGDLSLAVAGQSITLTLADEIDIARGDVISAATAPAEVADQFECTVVWMAEEPMLPGRAYLLKIGALSLSATLAEPKYRINVNTLEHLAAKRLDLNEIGVCNVAMERPVPFDPYASNRDTGGFILIDRMSNHKVGAGMIHFALRRSHNIHVQPVDVNKAARAAQKHQRPAVLWFTGLSGAGKSSIANLVDKKLHALSRHTYLLDGDNVRHGLCRDLGFTEADRIENIRRVAETAKLMVDAGLVVLTAFISPFRAERTMARELFAEGEFVEIHIDTPLEVAEQRDVKGLYAKARRGELANFTGIDSPYEAPEAPELRIDTVTSTVDAAADRVIVRMRELGLIE
jgi:bifunctional enzyme CysN/CysC